MLKKKLFGRNNGEPRTKIGKSKISKCEIAPLSTFFKESAQVKALAVES